jgi:hypothetical protein
VEIGRKRRYVEEVTSQFNKQSPVSYLCSVNITRPALAVSSYTRNPTGSGNRRQMATPSRSNLTMRWVDLNLLLSKHSSSSTCHLQVNSAFTSRENGPEAEISGRWRYLAEVIGPLDRPTLVCYRCSVDFSRPAATVLELFPLCEVEDGPEAETAARWRRIAEVTRPFERPTAVCYWSFVELSRRTLIVFELLALSHFDKMDHKRKSAVGGVTFRKYYHYSIGLPKMAFCVLMFYPSIRCRFRVFEGSVVFEISTGSGFGR